MVVRVSEPITGCRREFCVMVVKLNFFSSDVGSDDNVAT